MEADFPDYTDAEAIAAATPYPETLREWKARYTLLERAYEQGKYSAAEAKAHHLFRAVDDAGSEIDLTRRVCQAYRFVVDVDTRCFIGSGLTLEERPGAGPSALTAAEAVWRRSQMAEFLHRDVRMLAALGDWWYEAQLDTDGRARIVSYDPRMVRAYYSPTDGRTLERVVFEVTTTEGLVADEAQVRTWRRELTATTITETVNGETTMSFSHGLGVVPAVQLRWTAWRTPEHSLPAPHGLDAAIHRIDSFFTQIGAIGNRHAHPTLAILGAKLGTNTELSLGRVLHGLPADADAKYVSMSGDGIGALRQVVGDIMAHVRETAPEYLFAESAGAESGTARSYRAAALVAKIEEARGPNLAAIARLLGMAVAREQKRPYDVEADRLILQAPPVIAPHVPTELAAVGTLRTLGLITRADAVRHAQRLGLIDRSVDPVAYAAEAEDEHAVRAQVFMTSGTPRREVPDDDGDGA